MDKAQLITQEDENVPLEEADIERLLQDIRRQVARLEQVQDRHDDAQRQLAIQQARLEQMMTDRAVSCPWRVDIDEGLKTGRVARDGVLTLGKSVEEIKLKVAVIAAGGGAAGGLVVTLIRAIIEAVAAGG